MATAFVQSSTHPRLWRVRVAWQFSDREAERIEPAAAPAPSGLIDTLSPVDLPQPAVPLPHPLRWTTTAIATATLVLALLNAHALRSWSYQLPPNDYSARIVTLAEAWYGITGKAGLNRPVEAMHAGWRSAKGARFAGRAAPTQSEDAQR